MESRFLQIHTLTSYTAALLNRDDTGLSKRLPYGGALRTRISSQCLKRHWRVADDPHALDRIDGSIAAFRSRDLVTQRVIDPLRRRFTPEVVAALEPEFQVAVYGEKGKEKRGRQTLLFGATELEWLAAQAEQLAEQAAGSPDAAAIIAEHWRGKRGSREFLANIKAMRESATLPAGLTSALFGRMVTSDPEANITAAVHVAHSFTVHKEEPEIDYFTAVDDLSTDEPGADTIQDTEITSGLFYGYVVIDVPGLINNLGNDYTLARDVIHHFIYLVAEVSPGAKLGSTAPYGRASFMLAETGDRQPRSLAEAFRTPCDPQLGSAIEALSAHLQALDEAYATGEKRRHMCIADAALPRSDKGTLAELAEWARSLPVAGTS
ncbi:MAG: type I-E CRISPR-associated protein Cas7/Cse4/CasC [Spirochaetaceae bacterium]|nr:type I-E CRISPR-associated protein Cas7/Cse4/CasC [Spirochaetaceae bacterium]